jgi:hypothetical protein
MIVADLLPGASTFKIPSDSIFAADAMKARVDFMQELIWTMRSLHQPWMGTTGANLAHASIKVAEIESRYDTLVYCAIDEKMAKKGN